MTASDLQVMTHPYISFVFCFNFIWMLIEIHLYSFPRAEISRPTYFVKHLLFTISAIYIASGFQLAKFSADGHEIP